MILRDTNAKDAVKLVERIRQDIEKATYQYFDKVLNVTMTFGVCEHQSSLSLEECIKQADDMLYKGKKKGRNRVIAKGLDVIV